MTHEDREHIKREPTNIETHCIHYTTPNPNKQISYIYKKQSPAMSDNTLHIKEQWELGYKSGRRCLGTQTLSVTVGWKPAVVRIWL